MLSWKYNSNGEKKCYVYLSLLFFFVVKGNSKAQVQSNSKLACYFFKTFVVGFYSNLFCCMNCSVLNKHVFYNIGQPTAAGDDGKV